MITIRIPATSANLGPGFDCIGLALDLWNEVSFEPCDQLTFHVTGEGADTLNGQPQNLLTQSFRRVYELCGKSFTGTAIQSNNQIPPSSGMGSSASAIVAGIFGANEMLGKPLTSADMLKLATEIEGHPDNVAPALLGGLVASVMKDGQVISRRYEIPEFKAVIVKPDLDWPTKVARSVLPITVPRSDAIFNVGRTLLVVDAFRNGDLDLLQQVMDDRLHQPYRLERIPGGRDAFEAARRFGAAALSGAGPSIICFMQPGQEEAAASNMLAAFRAQGVDARALHLKTSNQGTSLI